MLYCGPSMILCLIMVLGNSVGAMTKSGKSHAPSFLDIPMMCSLNFRHSLCILGTNLLVYSQIYKLILYCTALGIKPSLIFFEWCKTFAESLYVFILF